MRHVDWKKANAIAQELLPAIQSFNLWQIELQTCRACRCEKK
jgi:hypothetical protein